MIIDHCFLLTFDHLFTYLQSRCIYWQFMISGEKKKHRKEMMAAKRLDRMIRRGVDLQQINSVRRKANSVFRARQCSSCVYIWSSSFLVKILLMPASWLGHPHNVNCHLILDEKGILNDEVLCLCFFCLFLVFLFLFLISMSSTINLRCIVKLLPRITLQLLPVYTYLSLAMIKSMWLQFCPFLSYVVGVYLFEVCIQ